MNNKILFLCVNLINKIYLVNLINYDLSDIMETKLVRVSKLTHQRL